MEEINMSKKEEIILDMHDKVKEVINRIFPLLWYFWDIITSLHKRQFNVKSKLDSNKKSDKCIDMWLYGLL